MQCLSRTLALIAILCALPSLLQDVHAQEDHTSPIHRTGNDGTDDPAQLEQIVVTASDAPPLDIGDWLNLFEEPHANNFGPRDRGGGNFNRNRGDRTDVTDASQGDEPCTDGSNPTSGNPVVLATGDKIEHETDFASAGEMPLTLTRTYDHFWKYPGLFGKYWVSSFDYSLVWQNADAEIYAQRPDGRRIRFDRVGATNRWNEEKPSPVAYILKNADGTYTHYTEANALETYDGGGKPLAIRNAHGIGWTYTYTNDYPTRITHTSGRFVQLSWTSGQLTTVVDPAGASHAFAYTANAFGAGEHRLASATSPGTTGDPATTEAYFYEDVRYPGGLTGKAYNGVRYSTFAYDAQARAIDSEHATGGIDRYTYVYTGAPVQPPLSPPDPPPPGSHCNPSTHSCPAPPVIGIDPGDPEIAARAAQSAEEDDAIAHVDATTSVLETNPLGLKTTYEFIDGKLAGASGQATAHCAARSRERSYDANGNEDLVTDFDGNYTEYTYNAKGQLTQKIDAYNTAVARTTTYTWDATYNLPTGETLVGDHQTTYAYTADHRIANVTVKNLSANGVPNQTHTWTFTYAKYASGIVQTMIVDGPQAANDQVTYSYAATGDLVSVSNTHGHATTYALYDGLGRPGRVTGPNGDQTDTAYYIDGRVKQITTYPNNVAATTSFTYAAGLLASAKTSDGVTTTYAYDAARRLSTETRNELNGSAQRRLSYDLASDPTAVEIYRGAIKRFSAYTDYDETGRVRARRGNGGQDVRYTYDDDDDVVVTITDSLNRATHFAYDALNRLTQQTDAKNGITKYAYDKADRVAKITDPKLLSTTYAYDGFGQLWKLASPDSGTTTYGYTASGFRNAMMRADGTSSSYAYDDIGRLVTITAGGKTQTFVYDTCAYGKGRICTIGDPTGTLSYSYTKEGRLAAQQTAYVAALGGASSASFTYDAMGRPATITNTQDAAQQQFTYTSGQLSAVKLKVGAAAAVNVANSFTYEPMGPVTGFTYGNGLVRTKTYDLDRRLTAAAVTGASGIQSLGFAHNADDAITTLTNGVNSTLSQTFGYDELMRLSTVTSASGNEAFTYGANGNRLTHSTSFGLATLAYIAGSNRLASWSRSGSATRSYAYDANGNTIGLLGKTYTYDPFNRLASISGGGTSASYAVNALGERVYKNSGGLQTFFLYAPDHALLGEYQRQGSGWTDYVRIGGDPIAMLRSGALYFVHGDQLGRPEVVTNAAKTSVWRAKNFAFDRTVASDSFGGLNLGLPGQYYDQETGAWYNLHRDYDPVVGRYLQADPAGLDAGPNPYSYVDNRPTVWADPLGRTAALTTELGAEGGLVICGPVCAVVGGAIGLGVGVWGTNELINQLNEAKDGAESKPSNCPSGTLPLDQAKGKFGLSHQDAESIKEGIIAGPTTWTGIAPNGDVWVGTPDGKGSNEGPFGQYLPGG